MTEARTEPASGAKPGPSTVRVRVVCSHCDRLITRSSRKGLTVRCPSCGTVNAGPGLVAEQAKPKAEEARRRARRRAASEESRPAPVRRKSQGAPKPAEAAETGAATASSSSVPPAGQRGFLARVMGFDDEDLD